MSQAQWESLHDSYCANRNAITAMIFVAGCAWVLVGFWNGSHRPHTVSSGAFSLFMDAFVLLVVGFWLTIFKCIRERVVIALWLLGPAKALLLAAVSGLMSWAGFAYRLDFAAHVIALIVSVSMLVSAIRRGKRPSFSPSI